MITASAGKYRKVNKVLFLQNLDFGITYWNLRQPILGNKENNIKLAHCVSIIMLQGGGGKITQLGYLHPRGAR